MKFVQFILGEVAKVLNITYEFKAMSIIEAIAEFFGKYAQ